jgi:hypothetical protein
MSWAWTFMGCVGLLWMVGISAFDRSSVPYLAGLGLLIGTMILHGWIVGEVCALLRQGSEAEANPGSRALVFAAFILVLLFSLPAAAAVRLLVEGRHNSTPILCLSDLIDLLTLGTWLTGALTFAALLWVGRHAAQGYFPVLIFTDRKSAPNPPAPTP